MMKSGSTTFRLCFLLPLLTMTTWGCVKRTEVIAVLPDGRVELLTMFSGDAEDIHGGQDQADMMGEPPPGTDNGWTIKTEVQPRERSKPGEETIVLAANMSLESGATIPGSYAVPKTQLADAALRFPTRIVVQRTADGTYYHFRRTYKRRRWAPFEYHRQRLLETDEIKKIIEEKPQAMTAANRATFAQALIAVATEQQVELLRIAFERAADRIPQLARLAAIKSVREITADTELSDRVMLALINTNGTQDTSTLERELEERIAVAVERCLIAGGADRASASGVMAALLEARRNWKISKDLEDESWDVYIVLPGKITAYNLTDQPGDPEPLDFKAIVKNDKTDLANNAIRQLVGKLEESGVDSGFETYTWSFDAKALHDRDVVLMATSFVPNKK